jgi:hypothetical protein
MGGGHVGAGKHVEGQHLLTCLGEQGGYAKVEQRVGNA